MWSNTSLAASSSAFSALIPAVAGIPPYSTARFSRFVGGNEPSSHRSIRTARPVSPPGSPASGAPLAAAINRVCFPTARRRRSHIVSATGSTVGLRGSLSATSAAARAARRSPPSTSVSRAPEETQQPPDSAASLVSPTPPPSSDRSRTRTRRCPSSADATQVPPKGAGTGAAGPGSRGPGGSGEELRDDAKRRRRRGRGGGVAVACPSQSSPGGTSTGTAAPTPVQQPSSPLRVPPRPRADGQRPADEGPGTQPRRRLSTCDPGTREPDIEGPRAHPRNRSRVRGASRGGASRGVATSRDGSSPSDRGTASSRDGHATSTSGDTSAATSSDGSGRHGGGGGGGGSGRAAARGIPTHSRVAVAVRKADAAGRGRGRGRGQRGIPNAWRVQYTLHPLPVDLPSFAAAVRAEAASWHPLMISAALNHTVKLRDALRRSKGAAGGEGGGGGGGGGVDAATVAACVRETLDTLYTALLPHVPDMLAPRYAVSALWVCAKTGYCGDSGSGGGGGFVAVLLQRLRDDDYALLRKSNGQTHGTLWWALSELDRQQALAATAGDLRAAVAAAEGAEEEIVTEGRSPRGGGGGGGGPGGGGSAARGAARAGAGGGMDLLEVSAAVIKRLERLDEETFNPQALCNTLIAAARLGYSEDPEFVGRLLEALVQHRGPLVPQDVSNAVYALGELYGAEYDDEFRTAAVGDGSDGGGGVEAAACRAGGGGAGAGGEPALSTRLPPALAPHARELACVALRMDLARFNPQALSNTIYGLARLEVRLGTGIRDTLAAQRGSTQQQQEHVPAGQAGGQQQQPQQRPAPSPSPYGDPADAALRVLLVRLGEHMRDRIQREPRSFNDQDLGNAIWALADMGYSDLSYFEAAVQAAIVGGCMANATSQNWAMFLWALVAVGHKPAPALGEMLHRSVCGRGEGGSQMWGQDVRAWSSLPWALAGLGLHDLDEHGHDDDDDGGGGGGGGVMAAVARFARETGCRGMLPQWLSRSLWALALMPEGSLRRHEGLVAVLVEAVNRHAPHEYEIRNLTQLWQCHLELEAAFNGQPPTTNISTTPTTSRGLGAGPPTVRPAPHSRRRSGTPGTELANAGAAAAAAAPAPALAAADREATDGRQAAASAPSPTAVETAVPVPSGPPVERWSTVPRLRPDLVSAARGVMADTTSRISVEAATAFQHAVYSALYGMIRLQAAAGQSPLEPREAAQQQQQAGQEPGQQQQQQKERRRKVVTRRRHETAAAAAATTTDSSVDSDLDEEHADSASDAGAGGGSGGCGADNRSGGRAPVTVVRFEPEWFVESLAMRVDACVWLSDGRVVAVEADGPTHYYTNQPRTKLPNTMLRDRQLLRVFGADNVNCCPRSGRGSRSTWRFRWYPSCHPTKSRAPAGCCARPQLPGSATPPSTAPSACRSPWTPASSPGTGAARMPCAA